MDHENHDYSNGVTSKYWDLSPLTRASHRNSNEKFNIPFKCFSANTWLINTLALAGGQGIAAAK